jgi:heterodisulfide reductase subunit C
LLFNRFALRDNLDSSNRLGYTHLNEHSFSFTPHEEEKTLEPKAPQDRPALEPKRGLAEEIKAEHGEDVCRCYQCQKCSAGCPMTFAMDYTPSQIMRMVQLGQEDELLASKTIWVCLTCNTCSIRCPNDIDIALVIDSLRERAVHKGTRPAVENVALFHRYFLNNVKRRGRTFEGELLARYQLKTGQAFQNAGLGLRMFMKGRLGLLPESVSNKKAFREIYRRVEERGGGK